MDEREVQLLLMTRNCIWKPSMLQQQQPWDVTIVCPRYYLKTVTLLTFSS